MGNDRRDARRLTRASRLSLGRHVRLRGEAANIAASAIVAGVSLAGTGLVLLGVAAVVLASGAAAALTPARLAPHAEPEPREGLATMRGIVASLPRS